MRRVVVRQFSVSQIINSRCRGVPLLWAKNFIEQKKLLSAEEYKKKVNSLRAKVSILKKERNQMLSNIAQKKKKY